LAVRSGQRIGLHRQSSSKTLTPFEAEIRHRLWWQILTLDSRAAYLSGAAIDTACPVMYHAKRLLNVNDCDLSPSMAEWPIEHDGAATEMIVCSIRYEMANIFSAMEGCFSDKKKAIEDLEQRIQQKYLRFCDPSIPLHCLSLHIGRFIVSQLSVSAHHPRHRSKDEGELTIEEQASVFSMNLELLESFTSIYTNEHLEGYVWYLQESFPYEALIYVLMELRHHPEGEVVDRAWREISHAYETHAKIVHKYKRSPLQINRYVGAGGMGRKSKTSSCYIILG
jgi:hypothetical protein